jgi:hypothetical protein
MLQFEGMESGYNRDTAMQAEFDAHPAAAMGEIKSNLGPVKEILNHPTMVQLVGESRIAQMLEHDLGEGVRLGDSKSIRASLADASRKIEHRRGQVYGETPLYGRQMVSRDQEIAFRRESLSIIKEELMRGRAEFIRKTGVSLPG